MESEKKRRSSVQDGRKKRIKNFLPEEDDKLMAIAANFTDIIDSKQTNNDVRSRKRKAWDMIAEQFQMDSPRVPRTADDLRGHYISIKKNIREEQAAIRQSNVRIGGDEADVKAEIAETHSGVIRNILGQRMQTIKNPYDSDRSLDEQSSSSTHLRFPEASQTLSPTSSPTLDALIPEIACSDEDYEPVIAESRKSIGAIPFWAKRRTPTTVLKRYNRLSAKKAAASEAKNEYFIHRANVEKEQLRLLKYQIDSYINNAEAEEERKAEIHKIALQAETRSAEKHEMEMAILKAQLKQIEH